MASVSGPTRLSDPFRLFLHSGLWIDRDKTPLSILSALARLEVDPWEEAAQLTVPAQRSASAKLTSMLANLPDGPAIRGDLDAICVRSLSLLSLPANRELSNATAPVAPPAQSSAFLFLVLGFWMMAITLMAAQGPSGGLKPASPLAYTSDLKP